MTGLYWGLRSTWPCAGVGAGARVGPVREPGAGRPPPTGPRLRAAGRPPLPRAWRRPPGPRANPSHPDHVMPRVQLRPRLRADEHCPSRGRENSVAPMGPASWNSAVVPSFSSEGRVP